MAVDYQGHYSVVAQYVQDHWSEPVEFASEPASENSIPEGTEKYIKFDIKDHKGQRDGFGKLVQSTGNVEIRVFGPRDKGALDVRARASDLDGMFEDAQSEDDVGCQFGDSLLSEVILHQGNGLLVAVYTIPFRTVAA